MKFAELINEEIAWESKLFDIFTLRKHSPGVPIPILGSDSDIKIKAAHICYPHNIERVLKLQNRKNNPISCFSQFNDSFIKTGVKGHGAVLILKGRPIARFSGDALTIPETGGYRRFADSWSLMSPTNKKLQTLIRNTEREYENMLQTETTKELSAYREQYEKEAYDLKKIKMLKSNDSFLVFLSELKSPLGTKGRARIVRKILKWWQQIFSIDRKQWNQIFFSSVKKSGKSDYDEILLTDFTVTEIIFTPHAEPMSFEGIKTVSFNDWTDCADEVREQIKNTT